MDDIQRHIFHSIAPLEARTRDPHPKADETSPLKPPGRRAHDAPRRPCKLCEGAATPFDRVDFNKFCSEHDPYAFGYSGVTIDYLRCEICGFIFTEFFDSWTSEDWRQFVYNDDYIKVDGEYAAIRPLHAAKHFAQWLRGAEQARILDYGAGAGVFVDRMRQLGFADITGYDPFSSPARPQGRFDIVTCFEVIEHSPDPLATIADMAGLLAEGGCILFSQTLQPDDILSRRGNWWYLAPRNGHVSTYADETLTLMGHRLGLHFHRGDTVFGYAGRTLSPVAQLALRAIGPRFTVARLYAPTCRPESPIVFPSSKHVWWRPQEGNARRKFRWVGTERVSWHVKWSDAAVLQVRLPFVDRAAPNFAAQCELRLGMQVAKTRLSRGDIVAEFAVEGRSEAVIELRTPPPPTGRGGHRQRGLAVPLGPEPPWIG